MKPDEGMPNIMIHLPSITYKVQLLAFAVAVITAFSTAAFGDQVPKYDRTLFGGWLDEDKDCQNTRHELLQDLSTAVVELSGNNCRAVRGRWLDPYTNQLFSESRFLDIDHLVPLKYGWVRGAYKWTPAKRRKFSNDTSNLFAVEKKVNRQKSALGPAEWLPPNINFRCQYILRFQRIIFKYQLTQPADELVKIQRVKKKYCE